MIPTRLWRELDEALADLERWSRGEDAFTDAPARLAARLAELPHEVRRAVSIAAHERSGAAGERYVQTFVAPGRFEAAFRGTVDEVRARYADAADAFVGHDPVVDIGSGRGELLALLAERGVTAAGVEMDRALVLETRAAGHDVTLADGIAHLRGLAPGSLGGVAALQVVEHLGAGGLEAFAAAAAHALRPGGLLFADTPNPRSAAVYAEAFFADPTHTAPIDPQWLAACFRRAGFAAVQVEERSPSPHSVTLAGLGAAANERVQRALFGPSDYAIRATR